MHENVVSCLLVDKKPKLFGFIEKFQAANHSLWLTCNYLLLLGLARRVRRLLNNFVYTFMI